MNRRGQLTTSQLIGLVIVIVGFVIVLGFFFLFDFGGFSKTEACKLSVLKRASSSTLGGFVPLNCESKHICLTDSFVGGKCEQFDLEADFDTVKLSGSNEQKARQIEKANADAMFDCWNVMGQGKLDIFGDFWKDLGLEENVGSTCVVCSRVAVSSDVSPEILKLVDINRYMEETVVAEGKTYSEVFTGVKASTFPRVENKEEVPKFKGDLGNEDKNRENSAINTLLEIDKNSLEKAYVFSQIKPQSYSTVFSKLGVVAGTIVGGVFATPVVRSVSASPYVLVPGLVVAAGVATYAGLNVNAGQQAAAAYCGKFQSASGADEQGCSLVQGVPYSADYINTICDSIQGTLT